MDQKKHGLNLSDLLDSIPESRLILSDEQEAAVLSSHQLDDILKSIIADDKIQFIRQFETHQLKSQGGSSSPERKTVLNLLNFCCIFDSVECAAALLSGEAGVVPLVNEMDARGRTALHTAAEVHARHCIELLLKKQARTDLRTRDGKRLLALDLSLCSSRMDVVWNPDEYSVDDLVVCLSQKDLTAVRLLSEKTKEIAEVAYAQGIEVRVVSFAALLMVADDKLKESIMALHDADSGCKEKTTIYERLIWEALALGREDTTSIRVKRACSPTKLECSEKRKLLLCEIELLQLFGSTFPSRCVDRKVTSPLILATQAGDETVIQLLLKTNLDINDADAEGNSALHWCIKTSKSSSQQQMKILHILLKHGARVSQKNKLGFTAVHLAAANGILEALQVLVQEDQDSINSKTLLEETPLFLAVKNDRMECVDLLLRHGANTEVLNLRRQRPIDMAKSQDMRFMLNSSNIIHMNHALSVPQRCFVSLQKDDSLPESGDLNLPYEGTSVERSSLSIKTENYECFDYDGRWVRDIETCLSHNEEEFQKIKKGTSTSPVVLKREIFVGGLPPMVDSDFLRRVFEEQFGPVEDAKIIKQKDHKMHLQWFGVIVFKHEESASAALHIRHVTISGKQVEIKRIVQHRRIPILFTDKTPNDRVEWSPGTRHPVPASDEMKVDEAKSEQVSWVDKLLKGQPKVCSNNSLLPASIPFKDKSIPPWFVIFKKWLPGFLQDLSKKGSEEHYALSSLKGDFRAKFRMELDHASLGFEKLAEFMRSFPELCRLKVLPRGSHGNSNHMVIVPNLPESHLLHSPLLTQTKISSFGTSVDTSDPAFSSETDSPMSCTSEETNRLDITPGALSEIHKSHGLNSKSLRFKPYELFGPQRSRGIDDESSDLEGKSKFLRLEMHPILEGLLRRNSLYSFFLRDIDFFRDYIASLSRGCCFACKQHKMTWSNFPCHHPLWCSNCKQEAQKVADGSEHRCAICDAEVQRIDPIPWTGLADLIQRNFCQADCHLLMENEITL
ncbi:hypothetical protein SAY87_018979 [Trapa incisa]|uniref:Uncharacterized protein n=1 Tax=Trapa incisa TaxID=236973 RepID=A0AAN7JYH4_9MYRT|nr:hypothetical protein SAY87_018979 [Trapa incisa]